MFETHLGANSACQGRGRDSWAMESKRSLPEYNLEGDRNQFHRNKIPHFISYASFLWLPITLLAKTTGEATQSPNAINELLVSKVVTSKAGEGALGLSDTAGYEDGCCEPAPM